MSLDILRVIKTVRLMAAVLVTVLASNSFAAMYSITPGANISSSVKPTSAGYVELYSNSQVFPDFSTFTFSRTGYTFTKFILKGADIQNKEYVENPLELTCNMISELGSKYSFFNLTAESKANTYTVYFNKNGGDSVSQSSKSVTYDSTYGTLPTGSYPGYSLTGWFTSGSGGTQVFPTDTVKITTNQTLYAHWEPATCTVTFNYNGGSGSEASRVVRYDDTYGELPVGTRTGYQLKAWLDKNGLKVLSTTTVKTTDNHELKADWTANTYTVSFDSTGGSTVNSKTVTYDATYGYLQTPTRTGYAFNGWFTNEKGGDQVTENTTVKITANQTLYAQWIAETLTVTFDANGGEVSPATKQVTYDSNYGELPTPTRSGYSFVGWYKSTGGDEKVEASTIVKQYGSQTLYAHWTANAYTVSFDSQGGSEVKTIEVIFDAQYGNLPEPTRIGYTFNGWYTASGESTRVYASSYVRTPSDHTLYAHWTANEYTVTFNKNGGDSVSPDSKPVIYDSQYGDLATATKKGHSSIGWFTESVGGEVVVATDKVTNAANHTLFAHYTNNIYKVSFDAQGGSEVAPTNIAYGAVYGNLPSSSRLGCGFTGWYKGQSGSDIIKPNTLMDVDKDHAIYAHWTNNLYQVEFEGNGGLPNFTNNVTFAKSYTLPSSKPSRTGYTFNGWYTEPTGGTVVTSEVNVDRAENHTLYAHWTANEYTVTFNKNGGDSVSPDSKPVIYDSQYGDLATATKKGCTAIGWFTESVGGEEVLATDKVTNAANHTLYAHYTNNIYTISFDAQGGSEVAPTNIVYGTTYGKLPSSTRAGFNLKGWYYEREGGSPIEDDAAMNVPSNHTLYALWDAKDCELIFNDYANGNAVTNILSYGGSLPEMAKPSKQGCVFFDYHDSVSNVYYDINMQVALETNIYETVELYPNWKKLTDSSDDLDCTNLVINNYQMGPSFNNTKEFEECHETKSARRVNLSEFVNTGRLIIDGFTGKGRFSFWVKLRYIYKCNCYVSVYDADEKVEIVPATKVTTGWTQITQSIDALGSLILKVKSDGDCSCCVDEMTWTPDGPEPKTANIFYMTIE